MPLSQRFNELLQTTMDEMGVSQRELARRVGTDQPSISRILSGQRRPSLDLYERLFAAVGFKLTVTAAPWDEDQW